MRKPINLSDSESKKYLSGNISWIKKALNSPWPGDNKVYFSEYENICRLKNDKNKLNATLIRLEMENIKSPGNYLKAYRWAVCLEAWCKAHNTGGPSTQFTPIIKAMWNDPEPLCYAWVVRKFYFWCIVHPTTWDVLKDASLIADLSIRLFKQNHKPDIKWLHWRIVNATSAAKRFEECYQYGLSYTQKYPEHGRGYIDFGMGAYRAFMKNPNGPQAKKYADAAIKALTYLKQHFPEEYKLPSDKRNTNGTPRWYFDDCLAEIRGKLR